MNLQLLTLLSLAQFWLELIIDKKIDVKTSSGLVRGLIVRALDQNLIRFLGIPYAEPPVGELRFAKPKPINRPRADIIDATQLKSSCIQSFPQPGQSEDCLTLNIWAQESNLNGSELKPVMYFIHPGAFNFGSTMVPLYNGIALAAHDVVVVTVNYRIGAFGFLYGADESAPGNVGLYDQVLSLKWIRQNIHMFGGDKDRVTIFGESAGAHCVSAHLLSPISRGLFRRAIAQSGGAIFNRDQPLNPANDTLIWSKELAKKVNCSDDKQWLTCLRNLSPNQLVHNWLNYTEPGYFVTGTEFIPFTAQVAFEQDNFNKDIDVIMGVTKDEGAILVFLFFKEILEKNLTKADFTDIINKYDQFLHNFDKEKLEKYYLDKVDLNNSSMIFDAVIEFTGDILATCNTYFFAKQYALRSNTRNKVFFYQWNHIYDIIPLKNIASEKMNKMLGAHHASDLPIVFGLPLLHKKGWSKRDIEFSARIVKFWTNFAKYGDPGDEWRPFYSGGENNRYINILGPGEASDRFDTRCEDVWKDYFH